MSKTTATRARPLSPHLSIYKPIPTMVMSIVHRITGAALYFGTLLVAIWLMAAAGTPETFARVQAIYGSWLGLVVLFGYTWVLLHHMVGGIRHLVMDTGAALGKDETTKAAIAQPIVSIALTLAVWLVAFVARGS